MYNEHKMLCVNLRTFVRYSTLLDSWIVDSIARKEEKKNINKTLDEFDSKKKTTTINKRSRSVVFFYQTISKKHKKPNVLACRVRRR